MSVQFGKYNFDGEPVDQHDLEKVRALLARYGPDGEGSFHNDNLAVIYRAFHTTEESQSEVQPCISVSGAVITFDGRLDNRIELIHELRTGRSVGSTDVSIVSAAYGQWGTGSFEKLTGDWALSIWEPSTQTVLLAKDPIGTRHLYYSIERAQITWSSILDPLLMYASHSFHLNEEYMAGWLSAFPAPHLTPYVGIHSVPPSCFVRIAGGKPLVTKYWDFDPTRKIRYRSDAEYEEHFRSVLAKAVQRRLRSNTPVLAELSGGLDSSSIVCVADALIARGEATTPRLDTISYYTDSEPNWNELPYVIKVEEKRGRDGRHINVDSRGGVKFEVENRDLAVTPGSIVQPSEAWNEFVQCLSSQENRVVLSGIGGDEATGGVPTPAPELADLLAQARLRTLSRQLTLWALNKRKPWLYLLFEAAKSFLCAPLAGPPNHSQAARWLMPDFANRNRLALAGYESRLSLFGPLPSFQENLRALHALQRQLSCSSLPGDPPYEKRFPYLDRDLLEFLYAVPREQVVRPGQRRSLMRRALVGIVPEELLNRRRKAYISKMPLAAISSQWTTLSAMGPHMISSSCGIVDSSRFLEALRKTQRGEEVPIVPLMRTLGIEFWLRGLAKRGILPDISTGPAQSPLSVYPVSEVQFNRGQSLN
jgi:asparagine synthase (glutamine-hydrolysing)